MVEGEFGRRIKYFYEKYKDKYPKDVYLYAEFESWLDEARKEFEEINPFPEIQADAFRSIIKDIGKPEGECLNSSARAILWFVRWFKRQSEKV